MRESDLFVVKYFAFNPVDRRVSMTMQKIMATATPEGTLRDE
jgi:hypothetical protein